MAYNPNSNNKSAYGDDLTEDAWGQSSTSDTPLDYPGANTTNVGSLNQNPNRSHTHNSWGQQQPLDSSQPNLNTQNNQPLEVINSLTPDDLLFVRSWQRDSYYYRVVPLSLASWGALWWFNKTKGLPNKPGRYVMLAVASYVIGKFSYKDEFRRRVMESPSNTPFMQAVRQKFNIPFTATSFGTVANADFGSENDSSSWNSLPGSSDPPAFGREPRHITDSNQINFELDKPISSGGNESPQRLTTSYDELRARNRGFST